MSDSLSRVEVVTLFVEDLGQTASFYRDVFGLRAVYEDEVSVVFQLDNLMINVLQASEAHELVEPASVAGPDTGSRLMLTIPVESTDAVCAELERRGVKLLNGPVDRAWGKRTAAFADPAGTVWEVAQDIPAAS